MESNEGGFGRRIRAEVRGAEMADDRSHSDKSPASGTG